MCLQEFKDNLLRNENTFFYDLNCKNKFSAEKYEVLINEILLLNETNILDNEICSFIKNSLIEIMDFNRVMYTFVVSHLNPNDLYKIDLKEFRSYEKLYIDDFIGSIHFLISEIMILVKKTR